MIKELINEFAGRFADKARLNDHSNLNILRTEYLTKISALVDVETEINEALHKMTLEPCQDNRSLWILAAQLHPSKIYTEALCILLSNDDECIWHEGIVEIFEITKDEKAIPYLRKILDYELKYDPGRVVAIRVIDVLADISTPDAINIIKGCLASPHIEIREEAQIILDEILP